jgi:hypothetical protein
MKKPRTKKVSEPGPDEIRPEYDFSKGVRNRYAEHFRDSTIAVVLDPDVADRFPNARAVNDALRSLDGPPRKSARKRGAGRRTA